jgi:thermitase
MPTHSRTIGRRRGLASVLRFGIGPVALAASLGAFAWESAPGLTEAAPIVPGRLIVEVRPGVAPQALRGLFEQHGARAVRPVGSSGLRIVELPAGTERAVQAQLARHPWLRFAELDRLVPHDASNDPFLGSQWHLSRIDALSAWAAVQGEGVTIAILDSGIDTAHPDLAGRLVPGYNFVDGSTNVEDVRNHGTRTAGTAAATLNNGIGVASVAGRTQIMPVRVSNSSGFATFSAMAEGLIWAADRGARVANLSFSDAASSSSVLSAAHYMRSKGGLVFVSAGNNGTDPGRTPTEAMIIVSATNSSDVRTSWSNFGAHVDLAAPGEGIYTTTWGQGYTAVSGTSYSAPMAAGVAALVMSANPALSPQEVEQILFSTAVDLGVAGKDIYYGHGRIDARAAVHAAIALLDPPPAPPPDTTAPQVQLLSPAAGAKLSGVVLVDVAATDNVGVARVDLVVSGVIRASLAAPPYRFTWDTRQGPSGMVNLQARAVDAAGNESMTPAITVGVSNGASVFGPR